MIDISIQLPDEIFDSFRCNPQEFVKKMKLAAAILGTRREVILLNSF